MKALASGTLMGRRHGGLHTILTYEIVNTLRSSKQPGAARHHGQQCPSSAALTLASALGAEW